MLPQILSVQTQDVGKQCTLDSFLRSILNCLFLLTSALLYFYYPIYTNLLSSTNGKPQSEIGGLPVKSYPSNPMWEGSDYLLGDK
jgi:hypothetical protein